MPPQNSFPLPTADLTYESMVVAVHESDSLGAPEGLQNFLRLIHPTCQFQAIKA